MASAFVIGGPIFVDTFLVISGLLVTYSVLKYKSNGCKFNYFLYVSQRLVRILPLQATVVLIYAMFMQHLGYGPSFNKALPTAQEPCQKYWWSALLNMQYYFNPKELVRNKPTDFLSLLTYCFSASFKLGTSLLTQLVTSWLQ